MASALDGITIIDLSRILAGPYATMMLADFGATVIKVERPGTGDETRAWRPPVDDHGVSTYYSSVNRNKHSIEIDLTDVDGRARILAAVRTADVVIENFKAGTMDRLGLGYDVLREANPAIILCSITGFGSGAGAALPGFDLLVQATGGLMSVTGSGPGEPAKAGVALVDVIAGLHAVTGILTAVIHRSTSGRGQHVEVNLLSSLLSALVNQASGYLEAGVVPGILGNAHPSIAPYEVFMTADRALVVAVGTDAQFRSFVSGIGMPALAQDPRFVENSRRVLHRAELADAISERLAIASAEHWVSVLRGRGVPVGLINDVAEAFAFAESLGLNPVVEVEGSRQVANPITMSLTPARYSVAPPGLGNSNLWALPR